MPTQFQAQKIAQQQILKEVKSEKDIIVEFYDSIDKRMQSRTELLQTRLGQIAALAVAVKKILNIFGKNFTIAGIDINQLLVGVFQLKGMKQQQTQAAETQLELIGLHSAELAFAMSNRLRSQFSSCFGPVNNAQEAREKFIKFREEMAGVKLESLKVTQTLNQIAGALNILAALSDDIDKMVDAIFTWSKKIIEAVIQATEAVVVLLQGLQVAGLLANIGPFNTLPGSLTVAEAYLACILSVLGDISDAVGDLEDGIVDFRESSFKLTLLFKRFVIDGAMTISARGRTDIV